MISLTITEVKKFMSHLLIHETFDQFYLSEADINTANHYSINGEVNKSFYSNEEFEALPDKKYSRWATIKPYCLSLIKGSKTPSSMKIIFVLPDELTSKFLADHESSFSPNDINGLFLNVKYTDGALNIITGTSVSVFTMDKSLDHDFDSYVKEFLDRSGIAFEETN